MREREREKKKAGSLFIILPVAATGHVCGVSLMTKLAERNEVD